MTSVNVIYYSLPSIIMNAVSMFAIYIKTSAGRTCGRPKCNSLYIIISSILPNTSNCYLVVHGRGWIRFTCKAPSIRSISTRSITSSCAFKLTTIKHIFCCYTACFCCTPVGAIHNRCCCASLPIAAKHASCICKCSNASAS